VKQEEAMEYADMRNAQTHENDAPAVPKAEWVS
jgi:hypothetical protein